ncbi:hypothetical protein [Ammoniphilus sp. 3BR4]|uniref:hypothetical protein n=1 Tax=Ammoniphilus sp. 3BR4 TaxID=3158265 RepID=UPI00346543D2
MHKVTFELRTETILRIKLLAMYHAEQQKKLAEEHNFPDLAHVWTESEVINSDIGDEIAKLTDEGVDFDSYFEQLMESDKEMYKMWYGDQET